MTKGNTGRRVKIEPWFRIRERKELSLRELSERSGIPVGTLSWWSHQLRQAHTHGGFLEVAVIDVAPGDCDSSPESTTVSDLCIRHRPMPLRIWAPGR